MLYCPVQHVQHDEMLSCAGGFARLHRWNTADELERLQGEPSKGIASRSCSRTRGGARLRLSYVFEVDVEG